MQVLASLALPLAAFTLYAVASTFIRSHRNAAKARALKCEEPRIQKNRYPFGIDNLLRALNADKAQRFPVDMIQRTIDNDAITYRYSIIGSTNIFTADPKNIQAILATNFDDFGAGVLVAGPKEC